MYVCVCNAVTERQIHLAASQGTRTLRQLRTELGVTAECGRCARCARDCLNSALASNPRQSHAAVCSSPAPAFSLTLEAA
ncbi:(2Fe-2S)-binding protein [Thauera sp. WH-2]|jgi:bacterioferritin-associated ferredoxin|uniref:(2Fe-2S)-binding protein n=1 Tax=unclassified Thauera TaxID=2609274 RepID=UPI003AAE6983